MLNLTDDQRKHLDELQNAVDAKLAKILSEEQNKQLKEGAVGGRGGRGPGGFGGFPQPGQILSPSLQDRLKLSDDQK
jgi:hypothetical protein